MRALTVHGTDVRHPRTRLATAAALPFVDLLAAVSAPLQPSSLRAARRRAQVLPCGVDVERFHPIPACARSQRAGAGRRRTVPAVPRRPGAPGEAPRPRARARRRTGAQLLTLGAVEPERVPLWVNAANAVLVPSEREGFGLAVLEALACDVPVLATPVGIHGDALADVAGTLCAPFELERWRAALAPHLSEADPRVEGRASASRFSAQRWPDASPTRGAHPGRDPGPRRRDRREICRESDIWSTTQVEHPQSQAPQPRSRSAGPAAAERCCAGRRRDGAGGFQSRGRARRRLRFLRKARELAYRDLGGLVFNLHRFGQRNDALVLAKLTTLGHIDRELRTIETRSRRAPARSRCCARPASPPARAAPRSTAAKTASARTAASRWSATQICR